MQVGILGSGLMGSILGTIFARAGHGVVFSHARSNEKLKRLARDAQGMHPPVRRARLRRQQTRSSWPCIGRIDDVPKQAVDLSAKVIVNCCLPIDSGNTKLTIGTTTSGVEENALRFAHW
jgi:3-hydroxyacyl-CoA dehydrogenase